MRIGCFGGEVVDHGFDATLDLARTVRDHGLDAFWLPQIFGIDTLTAYAAIGREVPDLELGVGVVPIWTRHPTVLAAQALTVQAAIGDRLSLGVGLAHQIVVEAMWGMTFDQPVTRMREYLDVLLPALTDRSVDVSGTTVTAHQALTIPPTPPPAVLVAALGPAMLDLCAKRTDGTVTWMTGPRTLAEHTVPTLAAAADRHGRRARRVVSALPVAVTDDPEAERVRANRAFAIYGSLPSYRAMLDREGAAEPGDVAIVGDADAVTAQILHLAEIGVTDFVGAMFTREPEARARTLRVLADVAAAMR